MSFGKTATQGSRTTEPTRDLIWWHKAVIDWLMLNPHKTLTECAKHFDCTLSYLSQLTNADLFKREWNKRREERSRSLISRLEGIAESSLETMRLRLLEDEIPLRAAQSAATMSLRALGYGSQNSTAPQAQPLQVTIYNTLTKEQLDAARQKLLLSRSGSETVEAPRILEAPLEAT